MFNLGFLLRANPQLKLTVGVSNINLGDAVDLEKAGYIISDSWSTEADFAHSMLLYMINQISKAEDIPLKDFFESEQKVDIEYTTRGTLSILWGHNNQKRMAITWDPVPARYESENNPSDILSDDSLANVLDDPSAKLLAAQVLQIQKESGLSGQEIAQEILDLNKKVDANVARKYRWDAASQAITMVTPDQAVMTLGGRSIAHFKGESNGQAPLNVTVTKS